MRANFQYNTSKSKLSKTKRYFGSFGRDQHANYPACNFKTLVLTDMAASFVKSTCLDFSFNKIRPIILLILNFNICVQHISATSFLNINDLASSDRPFFDDISPRNVSAVIDETAVLRCRVKNKGNRTVSWMRKRDLHILTTNIYTYTGDQRFSVIHPPSSEDWDLKIDYAQPRDSGIYECQVNTEPKINLAIILDIAAESEVRDLNSDRRYYDSKAARAKILGSTEIHVKRDSTIALACSVNMHASSVLWYHGSSIVDFDSLRGGISLETEKTDIGTTSRLMLTRASLRDSGNYTCVPNGAIPASVRVHVLTGEQPAAMQTSAAIGMNAHTAMINIISIKFLLNISTLAEYVFRKER
ncbi:zwei Ig domain protein zig-8 isoform X2 [Drosophila pseudoobscura]|uniref:Zwei Ig domain protein zig-8 isoform X2 n=1 Tax=Drosophila pseudoobscura pseudoobscura TaxID=46245 RepID=A0A0R3NWY0_DROPS|nr:zwei Ig domain protein zig-8 isoform X2 [Drosophila pseudoobscura]